MRNIPALTSTRFVAALAVFFHHYLVLGGLRHWGGESNPEVWNSWIVQSMYEGRVGVTFFFALSGFLLTARYCDSYHQIDFKTYWIKRFARIMPLYWTLCLLLFVAYLIVGDKDMSKFTVYFTLTQAFFGDLKYHGVETAWSLTVEETFYLTLPMILILFRYGWKEQGALLMNMLKAVALLVLIGGVYFLLGLALQRQSVFEKWSFFGVLGDWRMHTICGRFYDFAIGIVFGMLYLKSRNTLLRRPWFADGAVLLCVAGIFYFNLKIFDSGGPITLHGWIYNMTNATLSAAIIYFLCAEGGRIGKLLSWRPFVYLGQVSFAFYLVHKCDFTNWMYRVCVHFELPFWISIVSLFIILTFLAACCYEVIERPFQWWILRSTGVSRRSGKAPRLVNWLLSMKPKMSET